MPSSLLGVTSYETLQKSQPRLHFTVGGEEEISSPHPCLPSVRGLQPRQQEMDGFLRRHSARRSRTRTPEPPFSRGFPLRRELRLRARPSSITRGLRNVSQAEFPVCWFEPRYVVSAHGWDVVSSTRE